MFANFRVRLRYRSANGALTASSKIATKIAFFLEIFGPEKLQVSSSLSLSLFLSLSGGGDGDDDDDDDDGDGDDDDEDDDGSGGDVEVHSGSQRFIGACRCWFSTEGTKM